MNFIMKSKWYDKIAPYYDKLTHKKNYENDVALIKQIIKEYELNVKKILDIGCGTGTHAKLLTEEGFIVTGIDKSRKIIEQAVKKVPKSRFIAKDMLKINLNEEFDLVICMYGTIHYLNSKRKIRKAFKKFRKHLRKGGAVIIELGLIKDNFNPDKTDMSSFDSGEVEGSMIREYEDRGNEVLFSYNVNIKDHDKIIRAVDTRKAPLLSFGAWKELLKEAGFKLIMENNKKKSILIGLK